MKKNKKISFRVSQEVGEKMSKMAKSSNLKVSKWLQNLVDVELKEKEI